MFVGPVLPTGAKADRASSSEVETVSLTETGRRKPRFDRECRPNRPTRERTSLTTVSIPSGRRHSALADVGVQVEDVYYADLIHGLVNVRRLSEPFRGIEAASDVRERAGGALREAFEWSSTDTTPSRPKPSPSRARERAMRG